MHVTPKWGVHVHREDRHAELSIPRGKSQASRLFSWASVSRRRKQKSGKLGCLHEYGELGLQTSLSKWTEG